MALTTIIHCPECGATLKPGERACWMCHHSLEWNGGTVRATEARQLVYTPSAAGTINPPTSAAAIIGIVFAALAMIPALTIGFFITCLAALDRGSRPGSSWTPVIVSIASTFVVLTLLVLFITLMGTKLRQRSDW